MSPKPISITIRFANESQYSEEFDDFEAAEDFLKVAQEHFERISAEEANKTIADLYYI